MTMQPEIVEQFVPVSLLGRVRLRTLRNFYGVGSPTVGQTSSSVRLYIYVPSHVLGHEEAYFVKENSVSKSMYSEDDIMKMLEFLRGSVKNKWELLYIRQTITSMGRFCLNI